MGIIGAFEAFDGRDVRTWRAHQELSAKPAAAMGTKPLEALVTGRFAAMTRSKLQVRGSRVATERQCRQTTW